MTKKKKKGDAISQQWTARSRGPDMVVFLTLVDGAEIN
jgi:hypothetical protein